MESVRLVKTGKTSPNYEKFIANVQKTCKVSRKEAEEIASMYKHTFAERKEESV